jgi:hypothetical protein
MTDRDTAKRLLKASYLTLETEIDCTTCLDLVPIYVDKELAGADAAREMPELVQHLGLCQDCREEYEALRELASVDATSGLPEKSTLLDQLQQTHRS